MISILHVIHRYRGDYPLLNSQVALDPKRFRTVVCYLSGEDDGKNRLAEQGAGVVYLNRRHSHLRWYNLSLILELKGLIDREGIGVVNCQQHRSTPLGVLAALLSRLKPAVVVTLHGLGTARTWQRKLLNALLFRKVFRVVGISHGVSADIARANWGLPREKVVTIQNGLVYDAFLSGPSRTEARTMILPGLQERFWFGIVGRLSAVKNHETLLRAFSRVVATHPDALLVVAGSGELETSLKGLTAELGLQEHVSFLGFRRDVPVLLRALDVFLLPSLREGLPLSLLEAMASGLPSVAARVGGIPEVIGAEDLGRLVEPLDLEKLAEAMLELAALPPERLEAMGSAARKRALEEFSAARMIDGYERLYQDAFEYWRTHRHPESKGG